MIAGFQSLLQEVLDYFASSPEGKILNQTTTSPATNLSVVLPVFNEEGCLKESITEITNVLVGLNLSWEIIGVDDGSRDNTLEILKELNKSDLRVKVISFRTNFGQTAAMAAGIAFSSGKIVVTMDADGQNDPRDIPRLINSLENGADLVVGWRQTRKDSISRRLPSLIANWIIRRTTGVQLHDYGCSLKAFRSEVIKDISLIGEMHRLIPVLVAANGGTITEVEVNHRPRTSGTSKYGLMRTPRVVADLLVAKFLLASTAKPMHYFGLFSVVGFLMALLTGGTAVGLKILDLRDLVETPLPLLSVFSLMFSSLAFLSGLLAELLVRIYFQQVGPPYRVRWTLGL